MSDYERQYREKLSTAEELVQRFEPGDMVQLGVWYGQPYGVIAAIGEHARDVNPLYVVSAYATGSCPFFDLPHVRVLSAFHGPSGLAHPGCPQQAPQAQAYQILHLECSRFQP